VETDNLIPHLILRIIYRGRFIPPVLDAHGRMGCLPLRKGLSLSPVSRQNQGN